MKKLIVKSIIFLGLCFIIILNLDKYFVINQTSFLKHHFFYEREENSLDILIFGDSHTYCGMSSDIISAKTGLNTYNYGLAGLNYSEIYFNIEEAFKYQKPKLLILENYPMIGVGQEKRFLNEEGLMYRRFNFSLEGKKLGITKIKEAKLSIPNYNFLNTFNIFKYHENWSDLNDVSKTLNTFTKKETYPPYKDSAKDVIFMSDVIAKNFSNKSFNDSIFVSKDHQEITKKIIKLCKKNNTKLLLVTVPFFKTYYNKTKNKFERAHDEIKEVINLHKDIELLDLNRELSLDRTHFLGGKPERYNYNNQHLNYKGNIKVSNLISNYINNKYNFKKNRKTNRTSHDILYNYINNLETEKFEGAITTINNRSPILTSKNELNRPEWTKSRTEIFPNTLKGPDGKLSGNKIIGTGTKDGYVSLNYSKTKGTFRWSVWLKGSGTTRLRIQELGGDYTNYATNNLTLTKDWKQYTLTTKKEEDSNGFRCLLSSIQTSDTVYFHQAKVEEIDFKANPKGKSITIPKNEKKLRLEGWMSLKGDIIENQIIGLEKDHKFKYVSINHQIKNSTNKENTYTFETPKDVLEKGSYKIFHIGRNSNNEFFIKKMDFTINIE